MNISKKAVFIFVLCISFSKSFSNQVEPEQQILENDKGENESFIPTKEWKIINEGQSIPPGLHVRVNLETGVREAKLIDEEELEKENKDNKQLNVVPTSNPTTQINDNEDDDEDFSKTLAEAIKTANESPEQIEYISRETEERIKKTYKDYKQLKKDYEEMKSNFKTDMELITELLVEFNSTFEDDPQSQNILNLLTDLNYLIHQIDNAMWFIDSGGLNTVILPMVVNQTYLPYKIASLRLLGALTQNNPKAQVKVYENNFGSYISSILLQSNERDELSTALYAFGSLLRKFPLAQTEILSQSGTKALISILQKNVDLKVKIKVLNLISDIIIDKEHVLLTSDISEINIEKIKQYKSVDLLKWLTENEYCSIVTEFISNSYLDIIRKPDVAEDLIEALNTTYESCQPLWSENYNFIKVLKNIEINFRQSDDEYQMEVGDKVQNIIANIKKNEEVTKKDEL